MLRITYRLAVACFIFSFLRAQVYNQNNMVQSVLSSAVKTVMRSQGSLLGAGKLDVSSRLSGGLYLIDTWVELEVSANVVDDSRIFGSPCLLYTSPSPRDLSTSRMPSSA